PKASVYRDLSPRKNQPQRSVALAASHLLLPRIFGHQAGRPPDKRGFSPPATLGDELCLAEGDARDDARRVYAEVRSREERSGVVRDRKFVSGHFPLGGLAHDRAYGSGDAQNGIGDFAGDQIAAAVVLLLDQSLIGLGI